MPYLRHPLSAPRYVVDQPLLLCVVYSPSTDLFIVVPGIHGIDLSNGHDHGVGGGRSIGGPAYARPVRAGAVEACRHHGENVSASFLSSLFAVGDRAGFCDGILLAAVDLLEPLSSSLRRT